MTDQELLADIPDGATHVSENGVYYKYVGSIPCAYWVGGQEWVDTTITHLCRSIEDMKQITQKQG